MEMPKKDKAEISSKFRLHLPKIYSLVLFHIKSAVCPVEEEGDT